MGSPPALRIGFDTTPLLGRPTGVGAFVRGAREGLRRRADVHLAEYVLSRRGRPPVPPMALFPLWSRVPFPPAEWWTGGVDVVHGTNFVVPPPRRAGTGTVVSVYDLTPLRFPELASPRTRRFPALVRAALDRGAFVHTTSDFVTGEVVDLLHADPAKVVTVHAGVPDLAEADGPPPVEPPYVLALGTVEPRKDLPSLVRAFDAVAAAHPDLRLVVAGPDGWGVEQLARAVDAARHRDRIVRMGWVDDDDRTRLLRHAVVYAFPSRYEGFGFPPLEAMTAGVPVVATTAGSLPEVLGDGALLVPTDDVEALAEALERVLSDEELRRDLVDRGHRRTAAFDWDRCAAGLAELYRLAAG